MRPARIPRRSLLAATGSLAAPALAQVETRPIRFVVPYPPGGASDVIAQMLAPPLGEALGQPVVIENRPGANGGIAAELVARAPPDGLTLLMGNAGPNALNQALFGARLAYNCLTDFTPIALVSSVPQVMALYPGFPARTLAELIDYARAHPGEVNYAVGGIGSAPHLTLALLGTLAGINWVSVAFRGGQASITSVVAGQIPIIMDTAPVVLPQVREGRVRGIAVTSLHRIPLAPDLPTIAEQGFPGLEATSWGGVLGPAKLPPAVTERLHGAVVRALAQPALRAALARQGVEPRTSTPAEFVAHIAAEVQRWTQVVRTADIRPE
jgi:tripartite-type tricarboxylate transporter receptor subunit TctC